MANATLSPFREFLGKLEAQDPDAASLVRSSFANGDPEFLKKLGSVVQQHENIIPEGHNYNSLRAAAQEEFQNTNPSLPQRQEQQITPQPGFTLNFGGNDHASSSEGAHIAYGEIGGHLQNIQEERVQKEFEKLLANPDSQEMLASMDKFFDSNFDAQKLLSEQYQILRERIDALDFSRDRDKKETIKNLLDQQEKEHQEQLADPYRGIKNESARRKIDERRRAEAEKEADIRRRLQAAQSQKDKEKALKELLRHKLDVSRREMGIVVPPLMSEKMRKTNGYKFTYSTGQLYSMSDELEKMLDKLQKRSYVEEEETTQVTEGISDGGGYRRVEEPTPVPNSPTFGNSGNAGGNGMKNPRLKNPLSKFLRRPRAKDLAKKTEDEVEKLAKKGAMSLAKKVALWALGALLELLADIWPYLLAAVIIIVIIVVILAVILGQGSDTKSGGDIPGLDVSLIAPPKVDNDRDISYAIRVTYSGNSPVIITDKIPSNTKGPSQISGKYTLANNTILWDLSNNKLSPTPSQTPSLSPGTSPTITIPPSSTPTTYLFSFTVHPSFKDTNVYDAVTVISGNNQTGRSIVTTVGNPPPQDVQVIQLVKDIQAACPGGLVSPTTYSCIYRIPNLTPKLRDQLTYDGKIGAFLQCGIFTEAVLMKKDWPLLWPGAPSAFSWWLWYKYNPFHDNSWVAMDNVPQNHMQVGDVPIWKSDTFGHVAYVTQVLDNNTFQAAEANFQAGVVDLRYYVRRRDAQSEPVNTSYLDLMGWLRRR